MGVFLGVAGTVAGVIGILTIIVLGGVIWGVAHSSGWGGKKELKEASAPKPYAYLDASDVRDASEVLKVSSAYEDDKVLGEYAKTISRDFSTFEARRNAIMQILDAEFEPHSMTWDRFATPLETAQATITANAAQVANHMQAFDSEAYAHLERMDSGKMLDDKPTELKRLEIGRAQLAEMNDLLEANKRLLVEIERLQAELSQLSGAGLTEETESIASEISRLAEEARYYS